ncbi:MAG: tetratricopeptide repeat protein [Acidobacteriota bacterium]
MVLVTCLALLLLQGQTTPQLFEAAVNALRANRLAEAEAAFREVLRREPANLGALGNLGVLYSRQNKPNLAIDTYQRALRLAPAEPGLLLNLGLAYLKLDNHAAAKPLFARLSTPQARELHALCQLQTGEVAAARAALEQLPPTPAVYHFLSLAYARQQDLPRAEATLAKLYAMLPPAEASYLEGRVWYDAALFDKALAAFEKSGHALETGKTLISLRRNEEAAAALRRALAENPDDIEARYFLGALHVQQNEPKPALPLLEAVAAARPDLWGTPYYLGKAHLALGNAAAALPLLETAARRAPREAPVHYQLARALQTLGRAAEARQAFARVAQLRRDANPESIVMK